MKAKNAVLLMFLVVLAAEIGFSQTNTAVFSTNLVVMPENIRAVQGKVYDTNRGTNWLEFYTKVRAVDGSLVIGSGGWFKRIDLTGLPTETIRANRETTGSTARIRFVKEDQTVVFTNMPNTGAVVVGQILRGRAMRTGNYTYYVNEPAELWDCGTVVIVPQLKRVAAKKN